MSRTWPQRATAATPPFGAQGDRRGPAPRYAPTPRRGPLTLPIAALIVVLAAAAGAGSWYAVRTTPAARLSSLATPPDPGRSASSTSPSAVPVEFVPPAALYPEAALIQPVIAVYFQAINRRDYAEYLTTQSPGAAMITQQFQTGFRSTQDSSVLVTSVAITPDGRRSADLTFTSRQQPQDGPGGESCTNWHLTLFFNAHAGTYTIGTPPANYHASYQSCS